MPKCPQCSAEVDAPSTSWPVLDDPDKQGRFVERNVAIYRCAKCGTKFPHVVGRKKYRIIRLEELQKLEDTRTHLEDLVRELEGEKVRLLNDVRNLEEKVALIELGYEAEKLETEVASLRRDKRELQDKIDRSLARLEAVPAYR